MISLALLPFLQAHPPHARNHPASAELIEGYRDRLPDSLLALWQEAGLGFYGQRRIALIDPRVWQPVLDRWIASPPDDARRIPIALTPFGAILYYRKLSDTEEDVAILDPHGKAMQVLAWQLDEAFNEVLCDPQSLDPLIPPGMLEVAEHEHGPLAAGEIYEADQTLLTMQMLKLRKLDALAMHKRLRDAVDPPKKDVAPVTIADALPAAHRGAFTEMPDPGDGVARLYLSKYIDWFRLLALHPDGSYRLLFWRIHHQTQERMEIRAYLGRYEHLRDGEEERLRLTIRLDAASLGGDANDQDLLVMRTDGIIRLLRVQELGYIARWVRGSGKLGRSEYYFRQVRLSDPVPGYGSDGEEAPPREGLPAALRAHL